MTATEFNNYGFKPNQEVEIMHFVEGLPFTETYTLTDAIVYPEVDKKHYPSGETELVPERIGVIEGTKKQREQNETQFLTEHIYLGKIISIQKV